MLTDTFVFQLSHTQTWTDCGHTAAANRISPAVTVFYLLQVITLSALYTSSSLVRSWPWCSPCWCTVKFCALRSTWTDPRPAAHWHVMGCLITNSLGISVWVTRSYRQPTPSNQNHQWTVSGDSMKRRSRHRMISTVGCLCISPMNIFNIALCHISKALF